MVHNYLETIFLYLSKKLVNKFQKNIKFGLQAHFNMKIMLEGSNQLLNFENEDMRGGYTLGAQKG